jgi:isopentenyl-diphosphate delta-isomerase
MAATKDISPQVILVNEADQEIGTAEKLAAHQKGLLHRAFSIFIFRQNPEKEVELLLQQRAATKYHSPNLWTNTCCSHPEPGESILLAAIRRLKEELGLTVPKLEPIGHFQYLAHFDNGLIENELDHVLIGAYHNEAFTPNAAELQAHRWLRLSDLKKEIAQTPERFTPWLEKVLTLVETHFHSKKERA